MKNALKAFAALAQKSRMEVFRMLVKSGLEGMASGDIARALGIPHNTTSSHLSVLVNAGLLASRREGRSVIYMIDFLTTRELLSFLMEDCCQGAPEDCSRLIDRVLLAGCAEAGGVSRALRTDTGKN